MNPQEISIPVPWGHIAAKLWKSKDDGRGERVMCLHGYRDNCASFDHLIPMLDDDRAYLCVDWPNHGGSSGTQPGARWTVENYALAIRRVADHVQWSSSPFACLGHSMGGQVATLFTAVYPECVARLVLLDSAGPVAVHPDEIAFSTRLAADEQLRVENRMASASLRPPPVFTGQEALARVRKRIYGQLLDEGPARSLMVRHFRPGPVAGQFRLANDVRLSVPYSLMFSAEQHWDVVSNIRCPALLIRASESDAYFDDVYGVFVEMYRQNPNFRIASVDGSHDVHMNNPRAVATLINAFLNDKPNSKL
ncbi:serine hydrolase-like protein isoform X1 [Rhopalosiphum maidis]|uniref:serine hydrolase-like protein isoform X1 n=1 Tax=Rhopalosiphum maidis TaxID=43146 RepID=UPI000EFE965F|nr:serine hydrolase-like protein isoform X1 [Rhopalosiphum maidis]XP_026815588.1 serine hydrolase-like protein isoform X1 [Rhopalosiphum maidis]XP_026815590.1 serine hydrolase-like protein isoform X1 [Rhopalosiphum maidis]XP_026815591.1 serine hydrolase-like protein isoform X1 [Rhopalosiphum maidis]XP_026815592.1 serine hydrolase-like protein isoform X1 [Rhopalosiphum maidis]